MLLLTKNWSRQEVGLLVVHNYLGDGVRALREKGTQQDERIAVCMLSTGFLGGVVNVPHVAGDEDILMTYYSVVTILTHLVIWVSEI